MWSPTRLCAGRAAPAINALNDSIWIVPSVFLLASGTAIPRDGSLPSWLGWVAVVVGVISVTPAELLAFPVTLAWIVIIAVLPARRASRPAGDQVLPTAAATS